MAIEEAFTLYTLQTKKYVEGYNLLKRCPKFMPIQKVNAPSGIADGNEENLDEFFVSPERLLGKASAQKRQRDELTRSQEKSELRQLLLDATEKILVSTETKKRLSEDRIRIEEDKIALKLFQLDPNSDEAKEFFQLKRQEYLMRYKKRLSM